MKEKLLSNVRYITIRQLRGFSRIVEAGNISIASKLLHLTPPAVSLQLKELEKSVGIPLLERHKKHLTPTSAGNVVLELANKMQAALQDCEDKIDELTGTDRGVVSVGIVSTARYFVPTILAAFNQKYPKVKLQLQVGNREFVMEKLESLELDFAITGRPPTHFEAIKEYIGVHPQIIIAAPKHKYANQLKLPLSKLKNDTFLLRESGSGTRSLADLFFEQKKFIPEVAIEFGSNETIKQAVMAGMGVAVISAHTVAVELQTHRLVTLNVNGMPINKKWFVVAHRNKKLLPSSQELWEFVANSGASFLPNSESN
jgi:DNA-binding transcriptional LysR family regulator